MLSDVVSKHVGGSSDNDKVIAFTEMHYHRKMSSRLEKCTSAIEGFADESCYIIELDFVDGGQRIRASVSAA